MDWFDPAEDAAAEQARKLNHALKMGGRVLLRSASIEPWYMKQFKEGGFSPSRVGSRFPGTCIDRSVFVFVIEECTHVVIVSICTRPPGFALKLASFSVQLPRDQVGVTTRR